MNFRKLNVTENERYKQILVRTYKSRLRLETKFLVEHVTWSTHGLISSNRGLQTDKIGQHLNEHRGQHSLLRTRTTQQPRKCFSRNQASENALTLTK